MTLDKNYWLDAIHILNKSQEFLGDTLNEGVPGGENPSDAAASPADGGEVYPDEQNNEFGAQPGMEGDPNMMGDPNAMGMDQGMMGPEPEPIKPDENPFKRQNGKKHLDALFSDLLDSVTDSLDRISSNSKIDNSVITDLENISDNIRSIRETVYLQPIESSMFKYKLCVKAYQLISKVICKNIENNK
jgi:hypothetical protein